MYEVSCGRADDLEIELEEFYAAIGKYSNGSVGIPIPLEWKVPQ